MMNLIKLILSIRSHILQLVWVWKMFRQYPLYATGVTMLIGLLIWIYFIP